MQAIRDIPPLTMHVLTFLADSDAVRLLQLDSRSGATLNGYRVKYGVPYRKYVKYHLSTRRLHVTHVYSVRAPLSKLCDLPRSVTSISFAPRFNEPLPPLLLSRKAPSLTHLRLFYKFNQPLKVGSLPDTLTHLVLSRLFNQPVLPHHLPASLTHLTFGEQFDKPLTAGIFPPQLTHLTFEGEFSRPLPAGVLPCSLSHLTLARYYHMLGIGVLPSSLLELVLEGYRFSLKRGVLPASLVRLTLGWHFKQPLPAGVLPASLQSVTFRLLCWEEHHWWDPRSRWFPSGCQVTSEAMGETQTHAEPLRPADCVQTQPSTVVEWSSGYFRFRELHHKRTPQAEGDAPFIDEGDLPTLYRVDGMD